MAGGDNKSLKGSGTDKERGTKRDNKGDKEKFMKVKIVGKERQQGGQRRIDAGKDWGQSDTTKGTKKD